MGVHACIASIEYYLPTHGVTTEDLCTAFPEWHADKIAVKVGIQKRHIAGLNECASDLAVAAARKLFDSGVCCSDHIDFVLLCTQSPDYALPTTACLLQERLGIPTQCGALDFNLGCSGFIYGLGLAEGLVVSGQARTVLLITAETYSKYIGEGDKQCRTIFGDAAAATLLVGRQTASPYIGPFVYGTDGRGGQDLIVYESGARQFAASLKECTEFDISTDAHRTQPNRCAVRRLHMNGCRVFDFAVRRVPSVVLELLAAAQLDLDDVDLFVFHQANAFLLNELRRILEIPEGKFVIALSECGNTVSSTIPIALRTARSEGRLRDNSMVVLVGFGVGYSWGATIIRWSDASSGLQNELR